MEAQLYENTIAMDDHDLGGPSPNSWLKVVDLDLSTGLGAPPLGGLTTGGFCWAGLTALPGGIWIGEGRGCWTGLLLAGGWGLLGLLVFYHMLAKLSTCGLLATGLVIPAPGMFCLGMGACWVFGWLAGTLVPNMLNKLGLNLACSPLELFEVVELDDGLFAMPGLFWLLGTTCGGGF